MKYKTLLAGNNASIIDSFFTQMGNSFEAMTTSLRSEDIMRHVNYFAPNVFIYCLHNETRENMSQMGNVKYKLSQENIPFVIIGAKENCDEFERVAVNVSDMSLYRPLSAEVIRERITTLLQKKGISPDQPKPTAGPAEYTAVCRIARCAGNAACFRPALAAEYGNFATEAYFGSG